MAVKHPKPVAIVRCSDHKEGPLSVDECKELIGWIEEPADEKWGKDFVLKDIFGKKIRLNNNQKNRPFKKPRALRYANEHLQKRWYLNLESIVFDKNGNVLQGQHRLLGFVLADQLRQIDTHKWGNTPLKYSALIAFGASTNADLADTFDTGYGRKLGDVMYRRQSTNKDIPKRQQDAVLKYLPTAVRLVWLRAGGQTISFSPHFPHNEAVDFLKKHPNIVESMETIVSLDEGDGGEKRIAALISPSYAAGLHYLMGDNATEFWEQFSTGEGLTKGSPILALRQFLIKVDTGGSKRDEVVGTIIKAWQLWKDNKPGTAKQIRVKKCKEGDRFILAEFPRIGGLDSEVDAPEALSQRQRVVLTAIKQIRKECTYKALQERTGLQLGQLSKILLGEGGDSLCDLQLVSSAEYEPQEGETKSPYYFQLTKKGRGVA